MSTEPPSGPPGPWFGQPGQDRFPPPPPSAPASPPGATSVSDPPGTPEQPSASTPGPPLADDTRPEPGSLNIKGRRAFKPWHVAILVLLACLLGMWFAYQINGSASATSSGSGSGGGTYKLPTDGGGSSSTGSSGSTGTSGTGARSAGGRSASGATTTTTAAGGADSSTTTTVAGGSGASGAATSTTQPLGQEAYLVPAHQASGNWTSPQFSIAGSTWYLGWAFQCNPVPAANPKFAVYVVPAGGSPSGAPAVTQSAAQGQSVTNLTSTGSQQIVVQAPPQCQWVVKVTGYGGA